jgi:hypothetical protein
MSRHSRAVLPSIATVSGKSGDMEAERTTLSHENIIVSDLRNDDEEELRVCIKPHPSL